MRNKFHREMAQKLPDAIDKVIHECWQQGMTIQATVDETGGAATKRQVELRFNRFNQEDEQPALEELGDENTAALADPSIDSETKEAYLLRMMESQVIRLHIAAKNPRKVAIDLRSERLLGERLDGLLKALRDKPYEIMGDA